MENKTSQNILRLAKAALALATRPKSCYCGEINTGICGACYDLVFFIEGAAQALTPDERKRLGECE